MSDSNREFEIQPAGVLDLIALHRLSRRCFEEDAWPWIDMVGALLTPGVERFKAVQDGRIVGYVIGFRRKNSVGWIASIGVAPEARRQGIGSALLEETEGALGDPRVRLALRPSNAAARSLYRERGYAKIDRWPDYYQDAEDALIMEKRIELNR